MRGEIERVWEELGEGIHNQNVVSFKGLFKKRNRKEERKHTSIATFLVGGGVTSRQWHRAHSAASQLHWRRCLHNGMQHQHHVGSCRNQQEPSYTPSSSLMQEPCGEQAHSWWGHRRWHPPCSPEGFWWQPTEPSPAHETRKRGPCLSPAMTWGKGHFWRLLCMFTN